MNNDQRALIGYRADRARSTLVDAKILAEQERWNSCVNRLYYACFYAVTALLLTDSLASKKHTGVRALFNKLYVHTGLVSEGQSDFYNDLFEHRQESDYLDYSEFQKEDILPWLERAEVFVEDILRLVEKRVQAT